LPFGYKVAGRRAVASHAEIEALQEANTVAAPAFFQVHTVMQAR
jgi:hypothetical protein